MPDFTMLGVFPKFARAGDEIGIGGSRYVAEVALEPGMAVVLNPETGMVRPYTFDLQEKGNIVGDQEQNYEWAVQYEYRQRVSGRLQWLDRTIPMKDEVTAIGRCDGMKGRENRTMNPTRRNIRVMRRPAPVWEEVKYTSTLREQARAVTRALIEEDEDDELTNDQWAVASADAVSDLYEPIMNDLVKALSALLRGGMTHPQHFAIGVEARAKELLGYSE